MQKAIALYPSFTALDVVGPFQVLSYVPGHDVVFVAKEPGLVSDDTGRCPMKATTPFAEVTTPYVVIGRWPSRIGHGPLQTRRDPTGTPRTDKREPAGQAV